jgi:hypothetical protein
LPNFHFNRISNVARNVKAFMNSRGIGPAAPDTVQRIESLRQELRQRMEELEQIKEERLAAKGRPRRAERVKKSKKKKHEIYLLEQKLRAAEEGRASEEPKTGALPDFVVIGGKKCGTTYLYHLLSQHPLVEPAASKELHYFDALFEEDVEWYRQCFPAPRWVDGHRTITGEASPYMANRLAPERMAQVVPEARLIALLRNPVDRTYSDFQMVASKEREHKTFEEAIGLQNRAQAVKGRPPGKEAENSARAGSVDLDDDSEYISRSIYVEHLLRWTKFFPREQLLVLKSEEFFEDPKETLQRAFDFLGLPEWELKALEVRKKPKKRDKRNPGAYEGGMDPATRRRLEEYFEPHNRRLYDYLGVDLGW